MAAFYPDGPDLFLRLQGLLQYAAARWIASAWNFIEFAADNFLPYWTTYTFKGFIGLHHPHPGIHRDDPFLNTAENCF
jgi:hypothetical protein